MLPCAGGRGNVIVAGDHVVPPGFFDIAFQFNAQGTVIPETVQAAVDFARLKNKTPPLAQRDEFIHVHEEAGERVGEW